MKIAITGTGRLGASLFRPLSKSGHQIVAVVQDGRAASPLRRMLIPAFARFFGGANSMSGLARRHGVPIVWITRTMDEQELAPLRALKPDLLLVAGFGIILREPLLSLPRLGCVNMHSSLLPRHRGPNPFSAVILSGDTESGITFHVMEPGIDTGPIIAQYPFPLENDDTMMSIYMRSCALAEDKALEVVNKIEQHGAVGSPQDPALATYEKKPTMEDSWIDWSLPAAELDRKVRAIAPTPMPRFRHQGRVVTIARTEFDPAPVDHAPGTVLRNGPAARIATGEGTLTLRVAFCRSPIPWIWPAPWNRPQVGERLE